MKLYHDQCEVEVFVDQNFSLSATNQLHYQNVYNPYCFSEASFYKALCLRVTFFDRSYQVALVGDVQTSDEHTCLLEGDELVVLLNHIVLRLSLFTGELIEQKKLECYGAGIGIYPLESGFLLHGEMEVAGMNNCFEKQWSFSGNDVFQTEDNSPAVKILEDVIELHDYSGAVYELDYHGELLREEAGVSSYDDTILFSENLFSEGNLMPDMPQMFDGLFSGEMF